MQESFTFLVISIEPTISDLRVELSRKVRRMLFHSTSFCEKFLNKLGNKFPYRKKGVFNKPERKVLQNKCGEGC